MVMMAKRKAKGEGEQRKPARMVRVPEALYLLLAEVAEEEIGTDTTEHARAAIREYLQRKGKIPRPGESRS